MELTPNDIRNYEFPAKVRGYDKDAVSNFREQVANRLEALTQENLKLSMEVQSLRVQVTGLKQFEDDIKNAAIDARRNANQTVAEAKRQATDLLAQARREAEQLKSTHGEYKSQLEHDIARLELVKKAYLTKLQALIHSHLEWVESLAKAEMPAADTDDNELLTQQPLGQAAAPVPTRKAAYVAEDRLDVTESTEMKSKSLETFATEPTAAEAAPVEEADASSRVVTVEQLSAQPGTTPSPIDSELAAALAKYQRGAGGPTSTDSDNEATGPIPKVEVPRGYIAKKDAKPVDAAPKAPQTEYNTINPDTPVVDTPVAEVKPDSPEGLAAVLDNVVHKFEEEMDKAARG